MTDIAALPDASSITSATKIITASGKLVTYDQLLAKLKSDLIKDSISPTPSNSTTLSQTGAISLMTSGILTAGLLEASNNLNEVEPAVARTNLGIDLFRKARNPVINGDMKLYQRGSAFTGINNTGFFYTMDRWRHDMQNTSGVVRVDHSGDVPTVLQAGQVLSNSMLVTVTTADASLGASDYYNIVHPLEGFNIIQYNYRPLILSFWVKSNKPGIYCVTLDSSTSDAGWTGEYTINTANTWEKKILFITANPGIGTWYGDIRVGMYLDFLMMAGSTWQTTPGWHSGPYYATTNQSNFLDTVGNTFKLTGVQLEAAPWVEDGGINGPGVFASPFEMRSIQEELALAKRYYEKSYYYSTPPGTNTTTGMAGSTSVQGNGTSTGSIEFGVTYSVVKRTGTPAITTYDGAGVAGKGCRWISSSSTVNGVTTAISNSVDSRFIVQSASGLAATGLLIHYTSDAEF